MVTERWNDHAGSPRSHEHRLTGLGSDLAVIDLQFYHLVGNSLFNLCDANGDALL
jgi:hypothetical protein